jgi:hypothetical protein
MCMRMRNRLIDAAVCALCNLWVANFAKRTSVPRNTETMNYDLDIPNKEHQLQGNRDPGTVLTLPHFAKVH